MSRWAACWAEATEVPLQLCELTCTSCQLALQFPAEDLDGVEQVECSACANVMDIDVPWDASSGIPWDASSGMQPD